MADGRAGGKEEEEEEEGGMFVCGVNVKKHETSSSYILQTPAQ